MRDTSMTSTGRARSITYLVEFGTVTRRGCWTVSTNKNLELVVISPSFPLRTLSGRVMGLLMYGESDNTACTACAISEETMSQFTLTLTSLAPSSLCHTHHCSTHTSKSVSKSLFCIHFYNILYKCHKCYLICFYELNYHHPCRNAQAHF